MSEAIPIFCEGRLIGRLRRPVIDRPYMHFPKMNRLPPMTAWPGAQPVIDIAITTVVVKLHRVVGAIIGEVLDKSELDRVDGREPLAGQMFVEIDPRNGYPGAEIDLAARALCRDYLHSNNPGFWGGAEGAAHLEERIKAEWVPFRRQAFIATAAVDQARKAQLNGTDPEELEGA